MDAKQRRELVIAKLSSDGSATFADGATFVPGSLADGEVVAVNIATNKVETDLTTAGKYKFWWKPVGGDELCTDPIDTTKSNKVISSKYQAGTQKVTHVGYDGITATRTFPYGDNEYYGLTVKLRDGSKARFSAAEELKAGYDTASGATEIEVSKALAKDIGKQSLDQALKSEFLCSGASVAITGAPTNFTFTEGSKVVTWTGTDPTNVAAGEHLRLSASATTTGVVYEIASIDTTNDALVLVNEYQGPTVTSLTAVVSVIDSATALGSCGIQISGTANTEWKRNQRDYFFTNWETEIYGNGFDGTTNVLKETVVPVFPINTGKQIADLELRTRQYWSNGMQSDNDSYTKDDQLNEAVSTEFYDVVDIESYDDQDLGFGSPSKSFYGVSIAVPSLNFAVTVPATVENAAAYTITVDGTVYTFTTDASATTAELLAGLVAALGSNVPYISDGASIIYIQGTAVTVSTGFTDDLVVAANTAIKYPSWATMFADA